MPSFADIANKKANQVEKPPLAPVGNYIFQVTNDPSPVEKTSENGTFEIVDFQLIGVQALEDVDREGLAKFGGPKGVRLKHSFVFNTSPDEEAAFQRTEWDLTQFLVNGLKAGKDSDSLSQLMGNAKNKTFQGELGHRPDKNREDTWYPEIKKWMPVE